MRRWYMSAAALLGLTATAAQADYLVIRVYVGGRSESAGGSGGGAGPVGAGGGGPVGPGMGGGPGLPGGGNPGIPGGGNPGIPGGGRGPGGGMGLGGPGGGMGLGGPGGGPPGAGGNRGPGGGMGLGGPGGGMGLGGPGGAGVGGGPGGGMGLGGPGGAGVGGGPGGGMGLGGGGGLGTEVKFDTYESYVMVAVELLDNKPIPNEFLSIGQWHTPWGHTAAFNDGVNIILDHLSQKTPRRLFTDQKAKFTIKKDRDANDFISMAEFALAHGMVPEATWALDELVKNMPANANEKVKSTIARYKEVDAALKKPAAAGSAVDDWRKRLPNYNPANSDHYVIFYAEQTKETPPEVQRRLDLLEQNMRAFYTWFAINDIALKVPEEKLVAVIVPDPTTFKLQRTALDAPPTVDDGFFAPRDNVAVFAAQRMDEGYQIFSKMMTESVWKRFPRRDLLLSGKDAPAQMKREKGWKEEFRRFQTLALVDKALEHEAEIAAVSHEGTRQLTIAANLLPRTLATPQWISFGFASLFDTPKGPYPGATGAAKVAFWQVYGAPNWAYLAPFRIWLKSKDPLAKLDEPAVALKRTITDYYFQSARKDVSTDIDPSLTESERKRKEKELARAKEELLRARSQAWALTYYLAQNRMADLQAYFQELSKLPRDLELDEQTMLLTFARAFKLTNADGNTVDESKLTVLANNWFAKIEGTEVPMRDHDITKRKDPNDTNRQNQGGNGPGPIGPGGPGAGNGNGGPIRPGG
jgi:hypothetical protein